MREDVEIDTDSLGFRLAVAIRRAGFAFQHFIGAVQYADRHRAARKVARCRAFNRAVAEQAEGSDRG